jgi:hypothetical protein
VKKLIYSKEDLDLILSLENEKKDKEIERLNNITKKAIEYINENWGHWCSNHCKYATETINILKGEDKE